MADAPNPIQVQKYLGGIDYPASKDDIVRTAEGNDADKDVLDALNALPDREYEGPTQVSEAVTKG
jgi:hypothetical protein